MNKETSMSASQPAGSFEDKMKTISEYLRSSVIDPAETQRAEILKNASEESERILAAARAEADRLVSEARTRARHEESTLESALRIASRKAVDSLRASVEKELFRATVEAGVKDALSAEAVVKELVGELIKQYFASGAADAAEIAVPEKLKKAMAEFIKSQVPQKAGAGVSLSEGIVPAGFTFTMKDSKMTLDFSAEALTALLAEQLRPELRKYLFG